VTIRYADGSLATIQYVALGSADLGKERIEIFADGTSAVLSDFVETKFYGIKQPALKGKQDKGFAAEMQVFFDSIRKGGEPPIAFDSLVRTTQVTFAILQSLRTGKATSPEPASVAV
jgi:hypothetical protein